MANSLPRQNFHSDSEAAINRQINLDLYSSYVYLSMVCIRQNKSYSQVFPNSDSVFGQRDFIIKGLPRKQTRNRFCYLVLTLIFLYLCNNEKCCRLQNFEVKYSIAKKQEVNIFAYMYISPINKTSHTRCLVPISQ